MNETLTPDLCVIGGGAGGLAATMAAVRLGRSVVLIEKRDLTEMAAQNGMLAARALEAAAAAAHAATRASAFGIAALAPTIQYGAVLEQVAKAVNQAGLTRAPERLTGLGIRVIRAAARFADAGTVMAGDIAVTAAHTLIATGAGPFVPPIPGLLTVPYLTTETLWDLPILPEHLVVLGGGPYALEFAQSYRRLGSRVTVICESKALGMFDAELADPLLDALRDEGLFIAEGVAIERIEAVGRPSKGITLSVSAGSETDRLEATHLLVATAASPRLEGLGLEAGGIAFDKTGIRTDSYGVTSNKRVTAIGDVRQGGMATATAARAEGLAQVARLFAGGSVSDGPVVPIVVHTDPGLATVGLDEGAARKRYGVGIRIARWPFSETDFGLLTQQRSGFVKVIAASDGRILGAGITGAAAIDLIHVWALAISQGLSLRDMAAAAPVIPSLAEASVEAALSIAPQRRSPALLRPVSRLALRRR